jgi:hypothetical protein
MAAERKEGSSRAGQVEVVLPTPSEGPAVAGEREDEAEAGRKRGSGRRPDQISFKGHNFSFQGRASVASTKRARSVKGERERERERKSVMERWCAGAPLSQWRRDTGPLGRKSLAAVRWRSRASRGKGKRDVGTPWRGSTQTASIASSDRSLGVVSASSVLLVLGSLTSRHSPPEFSGASFALSRWPPSESANFRRERILGSRLRLRLEEGEARK